VEFAGIIKREELIAPQMKTSFNSTKITFQRFSEKKSSAAT
jgi:hypothetical protein